MHFWDNEGLKNTFIAAELELDASSPMKGLGWYMAAWIFNESNRQLNLEYYKNSSDTGYSWGKLAYITCKKRLGVISFDSYKESLELFVSSGPLGPSSALGPLGPSSPSDPSSPSGPNGPLSCALYLLGDYYKNENNHYKAKEYYLEAVKWGSLKAIEHLATMFLYRYDVQDVIEAAKWCTRAKCTCFW